ncbi:hypothetical protein FNV43_RR25954 [Rhamnella rubrinervis]|uniref:Pectinesterase inhibitor domain-containing protein n=1 Tax=Rhamnella rubrinervis TaxID=2594499 RepID=A0A8K0DND3_9ROSA|nr:hypothetical protein FNV43_RR25954 [Rhamnella rubrinervis]
MAVIHYTSFSLVFLATASIFLAVAQAQGGQPHHGGHPHPGGHPQAGTPVGGRDLCSGSSYPAMCRSIVKGQTNPQCATEAVVNQLVVETKHANTNVDRFGSTQSQVIQICKENYDIALTNLQTSLTNLKSKDTAGFKSNLSAALADYVTCDDAFGELGETSPVANTNKMLREMADTGLYLVTMVH